MTTADLTIVVMTWNRDAQRLDNLLKSLLVYQDLKPRDVIVVDTSTDAKIVVQVAKVVHSYLRARLLYYRSNKFDKPWALNVGIKAAGTTYIATTDMDFMFSRNFIQKVMNRLHKGNSFVMAVAHRLSFNADLSSPFENWDKLCMLSTPWPGLTGGEGTIQAAHRKWWYKVHGYDEQFKDGLGGMDTDLWLRAQKDGLEIRKIPFSKAQALHQYHPRSRMKEKGCSKIQWNKKKLRVVKNPRGWGE